MANVEQRVRPLRLDPADLLTLGFGTTVAMWVAGYFSRIPLGEHEGAATVLPAPGLFAVLSAILVISGWLARGRLTGGWRRVAKAGILAGALNLLIIGSVISRDTPASMMKAAAVWAPGSVLYAAALMLAGWFASGLFSRRTAGSAASGPSADATTATEPDWRFRFVVVAACATIALLAVGGAVTGMQAGLAVTDWPNSFGYNMFLYPLSRMTGGIYFEHSHRLFGSLVGLTTLVMALYLQRYESQRWLRRLGWVAFVMVCVQGLLGGLRVTGRPTLSQDPTDVTPDLRLAVAHGVLAQIFLSTLVAIAVFVSRKWRAAEGSRTREGPRAPHGAVAASTGLVVALVVQIVLGALLRHYAIGLYIHIGFAFVVVALAGLVGVRSWMMPDSAPALPKLGEWLVLITMAQLLLGMLALAGVTWTASVGTPTPFEVIVTTIHQTTGAAMLALSVATMLWTWKLRGTRQWQHVGPRAEVGQYAN